MLLLLLARLGPKLFEKPLALGTYWAYVFPLSALATAFVGFADGGAAAAEGVACAFVALSVASLVAVVGRMSWHQVGVIKGAHRWDDPIVKEWQRKESMSFDSDAAAVTPVGVV